MIFLEFYNPPLKREIYKLAIITAKGDALMFTNSDRRSFACALVAVLAGLTLPGLPASAGDLRGNTSCIQGFVDAYDFAELSQDFSEFTWDQQAGLSLSSSDEELTLKVLDLNDRSVCENVADLKTKCNWHLDPDVTFKVIIDNSQRSTETGYRLCAS